MAVKLRPSDASCWTVCTAMPGFVDRKKDELPPDTSKYADEGTVAHDLAAACLVMGYDAGMFKSKEMAVHVKGYVEIIQGWAAIPGAVLEVESDVKLFYDENRTGRVDACVVDVRGNRVSIGDLKYGVGVSIQARNNKQLSIYALSKIRELMASGLFDFNPKTLITLMIYQPRVIGGRAIRLWALTLKELEDFCRQIQDKADAIQANPDGGTFAPSDDTCKFCKAQTLCTARAANLLGETPHETLEVLQPQAPVAFPAVESLTLDQVVRIVKIAPEFKAWLSKAEAYGAALLHSGKPFPGFKLVATRANREWTDEEAVEKLMVENGKAKVSEIYTSKLKSPAQMEDLLRGQELSTRFKNRFQSLITKPEGRPTMVPEDDPREPYHVNPSTVFSNLDEGINLLD